MSKQIDIGKDVEMEHLQDADLRSAVKEDAPDKYVAEIIAEDHIQEIPDYYTRLLHMEEEAKRKQAADQIQQPSMLNNSLSMQQQQGNQTQQPSAPDDNINNTSPKHLLDAVNKLIIYNNQYVPYMLQSVQALGNQRLLQLTKVFLDMYNKQLGQMKEALSIYMVWEFKKPLQYSINTITTLIKYFPNQRQQPFMIYTQELLNQLKKLDQMVQNNSLNPQQYIQNIQSPTTAIGL